MGEIGQFNLVGSVWWVEFIKLCVWLCVRVVLAVFLPLLLLLLVRSGSSSNFLPLRLCVYVYVHSTLLGSTYIRASPAGCQHSTLAHSLDIPTAYSRQSTTQDGHLSRLDNITASYPITETSCRRTAILDRSDVFDATDVESFENSKILPA